MSFYLPAIHNPSSVSLFHGCLSETTRAAHREDMFWDGVEHLSRFPPVHRTERSPPPTWHLQTIHTWHTVPAWGCHPLCPSMHLFGLPGSQASLGPFLPTLLGCDLHTSCTFRLCLLDLSHRQLRGPQTPRCPAAAQSPASLLAQGTVAPPLSTCAATDAPTPREQCCSSASLYLLPHPQMLAKPRGEAGTGPTLTSCTELVTSEQPALLDLQREI